MLTTTGVSLTRIKTSLGQQESLVSATSSDEMIRIKLEKKGIMQVVKKMMNAVLNFTALGSSLKGWYINKK